MGLTGLMLELRVTDNQKEVRMSGGAPCGRAREVACRRQCASYTGFPSQVTGVQKSE